jgi:hypothetical protein
MPAGKFPLSSVLNDPTRSEAATPQRGSDPRPVARRSPYQPGPSGTFGSRTPRSSQAPAGRPCRNTFPKPDVIARVPSLLTAPAPGGPWHQSGITTLADAASRWQLMKIDPSVPGLPGAVLRWTGWEPSYPRTVEVERPSRHRPQRHCHSPAHDRIGSGTPGLAGVRLRNSVDELREIAHGPFFPFFVVCPTRR